MPKFVQGSCPDHYHCVHLQTDEMRDRRLAIVNRGFKPTSKAARERAGKVTAERHNRTARA